MRRYIYDWWRKRAKKQLLDQERPITEHLDELRTRLLYSVLGIALCAILGFTYAREIIGFLMGPLKQAIVGLDIPPQLHFTSITEPLFQSFRIALFAGIFLAFPFWVHQLWLFVAPGLYPQEKKMVGPFLVSSTFLFLLGATFAYTIAVPLAYRFLLIYANPHQEQAAQGNKAKKPKGPMFSLREVRRNVTKSTAQSKRSNARISIQEPGPQSKQGLQIKLNLSPPKQDSNQRPVHSPEQWLALLLKQKLLDVKWKRGSAERNFQLQINWPQAPKSDATIGELKPILTLQAYLALSSWFLLGFGLVFQTPLLIFLVCLSGFVTPQQFGLYRRHAFVGIMVISAVLTPTGDPLNLMIMAVPMYILFELGLLASRIYLKSQPVPTEEAE